MSFPSGRTFKKGTRLSQQKQHPLFETLYNQFFFHQPNVSNTYMKIKNKCEIEHIENFWSKCM